MPTPFDLRIVAAAAMLAMALAGCEDEPQPCGGPGVICTLAGTGRAALGPDGVDPASSALYLPQDAAVGPDGLVYVVDWNNHRIRRIDADGRIRTVAGTGQLGDTSTGGDASSTPLFHPTDVAFPDPDTMVIAVWHNNVLAAVDLPTGAVTIVAGDGEFGLTEDGAPALGARLDLPAKLAVDPDGRLVFVDQSNQRVRRVADDGTLETIFGPPATQGCAGEACDADTAVGFAGDGGAAEDARFALPYASQSVPAGGIAYGPDGTLYLADTDNHRVRALGADGLVSTVAGSGPDTFEPSFHGGYAGDGGPATEALLASPSDVAVGPDGALFIADTANSCIRRVGPDGIIETAAGICGQRGASGDGGPATEALLDRPYGVGVGPDGTIYVADTHNHVIRAVAPRP